MKALLRDWQLWALVLILGGVLAWAFFGHPEWWPP